MGNVAINRLEWDNYNIAHIAEHEVTPAEVEEVCSSTFVNFTSTSHATRIVIIGYTQAGKPLKIVIEARVADGWRVVTAHKASRKERQIYQKLIGGENVA